VPESLEPLAILAVNTLPVTCDERADGGSALKLVDASLDGTVHHLDVHLPKISFNMSTIDTTRRRAIRRHERRTQMSHTSRPARSPAAAGLGGNTRHLVSQYYLTRLRMTLGRLGRLLRQQNTDDLSYALMSLLFTIGRTQPITAGDLAQEEGVSPPSVTRSLARLVGLGLVTRDPNPEDRRAAVIRLTEKGDHEREAIHNDREVWLAKHLARLSEEDIQIIVAALPALERLVEATLDEAHDHLD
jgi:DNA-binding MarR family transcriptional regulator